MVIHTYIHTCTHTLNEFCQCSITEKRNHHPSPRQLVQNKAFKWILLTVSEV